MLFKEYDSAAHIAFEKDISYEEGRLAEQENTRREKLRADELQSQNSELQSQISDLKTETTVLSYHAQGKTDEEIAHLCERTIDDVQNILKKYNIQ